MKLLKKLWQLTFGKLINKIKIEIKFRKRLKKIKKRDPYVYK